MNGKKLWMALALAVTVVGGLALPAAAAGGAPAASGEASASFEEPSSYTARVDLDGGKAQIDGSGAVLEDGVLLITAPGVYRLAGTLDGSIHIDTDTAGAVRLLLCGLTVEGGEYALYAEGCSALELSLVSDNRLACGGRQDAAALYSGADLTVNGPGSLTLASEGDGAETKGSLTIDGGSLTVTAGGDGLHVRGSRFAEGLLTVNGGSLTVTADSDGLDAEDGLAVAGGSVSVASDGDGLKADTLRVEGGWLSIHAGDDGADAGDFVQTGGELVIATAGNGLKAARTLLVSGGTLTVTSEGDAMQAVEDLTVSGGQLTVRAGGGGGLAMGKTGNDGGFGFGFGGGSSSVVYTELDHSAKALKSDGTLSVTGGVLLLDCYDDAIHAAGLVTIGACALDILTNDDAVHSDAEIVIDGGDVLIRECFEGIEAETVTMNGGSWVVRCVNDGVNCSGSGGGFGWGFSACFTMAGGRLDITCTGVSNNIGDGVDSNGTVVVTGGELTAGTLGGTMENGMDVGTGLYVYGGIVACTGNSGMQEGAASSSTQCTATLSLNGNVAAGTEYVVTDETGAVIYSWTPEDAANGIVLSHPDFQVGGTYTLTAGSQSVSFTFDSTTYSARGAGFGFGRW